MESATTTSTTSSNVLRKSTKSPPPLPKDTADSGSPLTPERPLQSSGFGSPWIFSTPGVSAAMDSPRSSEKDASSSKSPLQSPADTLTALPQLDKGKPFRRGNRTSLLVAFKSWFGEDRKGKMKQRNVNVVPPPPPPSAMREVGNYNAHSTRRGRGRGRSSHRGSMSSRRSSSLNSRRSSITSLQMTRIDSPSYQSAPTASASVPLMRTQSSASRRSQRSQRSGSGNPEVHTPISEKSDFVSRPSSVKSVSLNTSKQFKRRSGSPQSSHGSVARMTSPLQRYHQRMGSNDSNSNTTVVRQYRQPASLSAHRRANSQASSVQSPASSRRASWYGTEPEGEGHPGTPARASTPKNFSPDDRTPRRVVPATLLAHKKTTAFSGPAPTYSTASIKRGGSSWKKSWGVEPPGWSSRSTHLPVEISIVSSTDTHTSIRDVFATNKPTSMSFEDDDEWEDEEDEEGHIFVSGVGQTRRGRSGKPGKHSSNLGDSGIFAIPPLPKFKQESRLSSGTSHESPSGSSKRGGLGGSRGRRGNTNLTLNLSHSHPGAARNRGGGSPIAPNMQLPDVSSSLAPVGRRIPSGNNAIRGQAPIQEEEEEEEE